MYLTPTGESLRLLVFPPQLDPFPSVYATPYSHQFQFFYRHLVLTFKCNVPQAFLFIIVVVSLRQGVSVDDGWREIANLVK